MTCIRCNRATRTGRRERNAKVAYIREGGRFGRIGDLCYDCLIWAQEREREREANA